MPPLPPPTHTPAMTSSYESTSDPSGFLPAAVEEGSALLAPPCKGCEGEVPRILRRPERSRPNYRSGVPSTGPFPGTVPGRDFVTGVDLPASNATRRVL